MALSERLALLVSLDSQGAVRGLESIGKAADRNLGRMESKLDRAGKRFQKAGVGMLATSGLLATGLYKAGQSAADLEQAVGGTEAVFKDASGTIDKFASGAAKSMGLSERAFREATTRIGGQLKGVGFDIDSAAEKSIELTGIAADLAATFGTTTAEAVDALSAAFRGEADPAERLNLRLNQTTVNAKAVALGLAASTSEVSAQAKAQATLALITEQSADALGQFGRESGTAATQMQIANASFENAKAALGQAVAPIIADVAGGLTDLSGGFLRANEASGGLLSKLAVVGTIGLGAAGGLSFVVGQAIDMRDNLSKLGGVFRNTEGGLSRLGKAGVIAGIGLGALAAIQVGRSLNQTKVDMDELTRALADNTREGERNLKQQVFVLESMGALDETVRQAADANVIQAEALIDVAEAAGLSGDRIAELREITDGKREADVEGGKAQQQYAEETQAAIDPTAGLTDKITEQTDALEGLLDATLSMFDANIGYRQSVDDVQDKLSELNELQKAGKTGTEEYEDAVLAAESALLDQADAAVRLYEETVKANGGTLTAAEKTAIYRDSLVKLRDQLAPGSPLRAALDGYIGQLDAIPRNVTTELQLRIREARIRIGQQRFNELDARAEGGPVRSGRTYLVGERGPELLTMGGSGFVTPNEALGVGGTTNVYITTAADPQAVVEAIKRYTRSNGPLPSALVA